MTDAKPVLAATAWPTNADMILDVVRLGYLHKSSITLDPTYGRGTWWAKWRPEILEAHDLAIDGTDFRALPFIDGTFDVVCLDPPYKYNGTPTPDVDGRYGVGTPTRWQDREALIRQGIAECARVLVDRGYLLLKCQDQVCSGKIRWQTDEFTLEAAKHGLAKVDRLDLLGHRPQPMTGRVQRHAHRNSSTLLVFRKGA